MIENKKSKTFILISIIISALFIFYFLLFSKNLEIKVYNKTNYDIDSLKIDNHYYKIEKNKSLVINCHELLFQDELPFGFPEAIIKGKTADTTSFFLCGTGVEKIKSGKYKFDLNNYDDKYFYSLYWTKH
jgi:hypothetical protein